MAATTRKRSFLQLNNELQGKAVAFERKQQPFCYGDEENARIYAVHLTTANQSEIRRAHLVSVMVTRNRTCNFTLFQVYYNIAFFIIR